MQCPYCKTVIKESTKDCPKCDFSLASLEKVIGPVPHLNAGVNDKLNLLKRADSTRIRRRLALLNKDFPQVEMHVYLQTFDPEFPLRVHLFWAFNMGGICKEQFKGNKNHTILLILDPKQGKVGLMVGYGLEPFLPQKALDYNLEKVHVPLEKKNYTQAIISIIDSMHDLLLGVHKNLNDNLGAKTTKD